MPALICASFSDHGLHSRGSFEGYRRIGSTHRFLYTHRGGKWSTYYSPESLALQSRFFDCFLKGEDNGMRDAVPVRLEIRARADEVHALRDEREWPPARRCAGRRSTLGAGRAPCFTTSRRERPRNSTSPTGSSLFTFRVSEEMDVVGPMKLRLYVELEGAPDAHLFVGVSKIEGAKGRELRFEGPFGFGCDVVAKGWLRLAHRRVDESRGEPHRPYYPHDRAEPMRLGEVVPIDIEILPSATHFAGGDSLCLHVQGHWFWRRSMFFGMFPGTYAPSAEAKVRLHFGDGRDAHLLVPQTR